MGIGKIHKQERVCNVVWAFFLPIGGYLLVIALYLLRNRTSKELEEEEEEEMGRLILFTDKVDKRKEMNTVSLEETLSMEDVSEKRQQLISALKKDVSKHIDKLRLALRDSDSETSHYAASAISELKRNLELQIQSFTVEHEENKGNIEFEKDYREILIEYINSGFLDVVTKKRVQYTFIEVLETLIEGLEDNETYYFEIINTLTELKEIEKAREYCNKLIEVYEDEDVFITIMNYYYQIKDKEGLLKTLDSMKNSPIKLTQRGISIIRTWMSGW